MSKMELTLSSRIYQRDIRNAYNSETEAFDAGKRVQLEHDRWLIEQDVPKPGEDRLLKEEEITNLWKQNTGHYPDDKLSRMRQSAQAQLARDIEWEAKIAFIKEAELARLKEDHLIEMQQLGESITEKKDAECQERINRIIQQVLERANLNRVLFDDLVVIIKQEGIE